MVDPPKSLDATLEHRLRRAAAHATRALAQALASSGITPAEWTLLHALHDGGAVAPSALADACGITRGAVTRLVDQLRAKRLVVRAGAGGADRRFQTIALTGAGARLIPDLVARAAVADAACFTWLAPRDRARLSALLALPSATNAE